MPPMFEPLEYINKEIRVLSILEDHTKDYASTHDQEASAAQNDIVSRMATEEIRGTVCPTSLGSKRAEDTYCALSYVWGVQEPKTPITLNGQPFATMPNLYSALQHIRRHPRTRGRKLWIDSVCINQADLEEKSRQVDMMGEIYRHADQVFVWLGEEGDGSNLAMDLLASVPVSGGDAALKRFLEESSDRNEAWVALRRLFEREYWERLWVLQEILLSQQAHLICGNRMCPWESVTTLLTRSYYDNNIEIQTRLMKDVILEQKMVLFVDVFNSRKAGMTDLLNYLVLSRQRKASVGHDHIYGMMGLIDKRVLHTDYNMPVEDVYRAMVIYMLKLKEDLSILSMCCEISDRNGMLTWVPDWRVPFRESYLAILLCRHEYDAGLASVHKPSLALLQDNRVLQIKGYLVDTIKFASFPQPPLSRWAQVNEDWTAWLAQPKNRASRYGDFRGQREAFRASLYCNYGTHSIQVDGFDQYFDLAVSESDKRPTRDDFTDPENSFGSVTRQFFGTYTGYMGRGLYTLLSGDVVVVFQGAKVPFVLRKSNREGFYFLVGECYLHGIMDGEILRDEKNYQAGYFCLI